MVYTLLNSAKSMPATKPGKILILGRHCCLEWQKEKLIWQKINI